MPENIYEESDYKIKATLKEGGITSKAYTGKLDVFYYKNGNEGAPIKTDADKDVAKGGLEILYKVPKVANTEDNYTLKIVAKYGKTKEKTKVLGEAVVWPKQVVVRIKDQETKKPLAHCGYVVNQASSGSIKGDSNELGLGTQNLKKAPYTITIKAPYTLVSDTVDPKRDHAIIVRKNPVAVFVKPDITQAFYIANGTGGKDKGVRQFVNVATADEGCDAKGNQIEFEVANVVRADGVNNDKIYIKVEFTKLSTRNLPKPALLAPVEGLAESGGGKVFKGLVRLTADGGTAKFKVELGHAGGETFTVSCGYSEKDPTDDQVILVTWRKLGYQLRFPNLMKARMTERTRADATKYHDIPDSIYDFVKARLDPVWVKYENIKSHAYADPAADAPSMMTRGFIAGTANATKIFVLDGSANWATGATAFDAAADNREIHVTLCDAAFSSNGKVANPTLLLKQADTTTAVDADSSYHYFIKTPKAANRTNLIVAGYFWKAHTAGMDAALLNKKPTLTVSDLSAGGLGANTFSVHESAAGAAAINVTLTGANVLPPLEKAKIQTYYDNCFTNAKAIRQAENKLQFEVDGSSGQAGDDVRRQAVHAAINSIHTASARKVLFHPGLDDDGVPLQGPMTDVTITHVSSRKMKFVLPKRASATDPMLPGDFAGVASATHCPVSVEFKADATYEINGNAGRGNQLLVLRDTVPGPCSSTVCHELGHSMGMTVMPVTGAKKYPTPPGLTAPKHVDNGGPYYLDGPSPFTGGIRDLHRGPHCSDGMPTSKRADSKFNGWDPTTSKPGCIMWGSGGDDDVRKKYCAVCTEILKARQLTDVRSDWDGRAAG